MWVHIYRATRGKYTKPIPLLEAGITWINEQGKATKPPKKAKCSHPNHNGRKISFPLEELFYQMWHLTKKELKEAVDQYDMASLEHRGRIVCNNCKNKIIKPETVTE